jgi:PAS domain S-box-containing protein
MASRQITDFVNGTADAAFAINESGVIGAWNIAAEQFFGLTAANAIGLACHQVLQGADESGMICSEHCAIQRALRANNPLPNFDARVQTIAGRQWVNISILMVTEPHSGGRHAIHTRCCCRRHINSCLNGVTKSSGG